MRKCNLIHFPTVLYPNCPPVPFSSLLLLVPQNRSSNPSFVQDYTFLTHHIFSLVSSTSFSGRKKRLGTTTLPEWSPGTVQHLCGAYFRILCNNDLLTLAHAPCRFLSKLCDQIVALISDEHSESLVFKGNTEHIDMEFDDFDALDHSDRLFDFEVQQTGQQEDTATAGEGFKVILTQHLEAIC